MLKGFCFAAFLVRCLFFPRTKKAAKQNPLSIRKEIFEESNKPEDGHVGRNM
jgi:hypothetical protein